MKTHLRPSLQFSSYIMTQELHPISRKQSLPIPPLEISLHSRCPLQVPSTPHSFPLLLLLNSVKLVSSKVFVSSFLSELTKIFQRMRRNTGKNPKVELMLNLTREGPSRRASREQLSPKRSSTSSSSPPSSCVSTESEQMQGGSPEAKSMVLAGCPRCLIYVMLSEDDPKCPKCKSTVILDFHHSNRKS